MLFTAAVFGVSSDLNFKPFVSRRQLRSPLGAARRPDDFFVADENGDAARERPENDGKNKSSHRPARFNPFLFHVV